MQDAPESDRFKNFTDSVANISKLGQRLAALQEDVVAIEALPVDDNGDAEATVSVGKAGSPANIGLRLPPSAMLLVKREEVTRAIEELKSEFNEILDHAGELASRCKPEPAAPTVGPRISADVDVLERMEREMKELELVGPLGDAPPRQSANGQPPHPPQRPRIGPPRLRDVFNRRPQVAAE
jgi:hypothetical protein